MFLKLLTSRCGPNLSQAVGDVIEVGDSEGVRMIEAGQAEPIREKSTDKAVGKKQTEKAAK